ncbi:glycogen-branching enzyme [Sphingomonas melonis TY]|nr:MULTISPECIES: 1,4-alpha-glucan branching protein GlgB [Sphingomonas]MBI0530976.1 1,4-alpha-glucan branching protein GlgB [Sphingomonas sp. TX0522]AOW23523.1 1,4-alpha-glucan branching enzyme [Sphingomonas melonis TY]ATI54467.1 1,4-alpha-glucan branching protein GlgB [Sphingomonas melonis]KZB97104.1 glycogen-branching enzyme [Sphingomonas melonis TY]MBX8844565.1 1,4-alpha-glucan branching protein GlgB [Sphingomonas melonis]
MKPPRGAIAALLAGRHDDPFSLLGVFAGPNGTFARTLIPGAETAEAYDLSGTSLGRVNRVDDNGLFEGAIDGDPQPVKYRAQGYGAEWWVTDPYSFGPVLGPTDDYLIAEGSHFRLYDKMGAHLIEHQGASGMHFAVWAPNAQRVSVVGDFNDWNDTRHVMRRRADIGVWEIFLPDIGAGRSYKFAILGPDGTLQPLKADPFAFQSELRPKTASITTAPSAHDWGDAVHRDSWSRLDPRRVPMSIYEVHAGSWDRDENGWYLSWDALADRLIPYVVDMGFTHIEFMPISEHPYDPSWGYQTTGLYAPSARFGDPDGFARFVDGAHQAGIGVLLDWVPAHFPVDVHGLARFDGTALYEHEDPRLGFHPDWNTAIYNFGRREVRSFLINNALFWTERYHVDGLRVDAVASMLYRDYSRKAGEWIPNDEGGRENWEAVHFLRDMNRAVYGKRDGVFTVAEESTSWPGVSTPAFDDGPRTNLGFGFKWNMGWMHDTLQYFAREPIHRRHHHGEITFGLVYAFDENFVLPLSHDEVVHGKGSLLAKMAGDDWQQFANLRAYYAFMWGYPGKKLLFMGQEFAQRQEWSEDRALDWHLRCSSSHEGIRNLVRDLNRLYRETPALHARDCEGEGFEWLIGDDAANSVFAWLRKAPGEKPVAVIANLTPVARAPYRVPLPHDGRWREIINSDAHHYWGSGLGNMGGVDAKDGAAWVTLPPLATIMLQYDG